MKKPWRATAVILAVVETISSCSITQATTSPLASDIAAMVDDGGGDSHHSKDRAEEELREFSRIESFGKDLQHQQQLQQLKSEAGPNENKLMGFFLQEAEMDEGDAYPASIRKTAAITTTTTNNVQFSGDDVSKESHYYHYRPSSSSNKATRRTENDRELQRYHGGDDDDNGTNYNENDDISSTETPTATPSSAPTTTTTLASSAPTLSVATTSHRSNNGYGSFFFPKAHPSPSTIVADSRYPIKFLTGAPTTNMAIRGAAAEATTSSPQTTAVGSGITETDSYSYSSPSPSFPTAPPSTLVSLEEPLQVDGASRLLLPTWGLSSTAATTAVVVAAVVLAGFPFTEIIV